MGREPLDELLATLDDDTRARWAKVLEQVDEELRDRGPCVVQEHLDAALKHLLALGWALHRCYTQEEAAPVMGPLGDAACTVEELRRCLDLLVRRPEWQQ